MMKRVAKNALVLVGCVALASLFVKVGYDAIGYDFNLPYLSYWQIARVVMSLKIMANLFRHHQE